MKSFRLRCEVMGSYVSPESGGQRVGLGSADDPDELRYERGGNSDERKHGAVSSGVAPEQSGAAQVGSAAFSECELVNTSAGFSRFLPVDRTRSW